MSPDPLSATQADVNRAQDRLRRAMMGPPLNQSGVQLDAAATTGEGDLPTAEMLWRKYVPRVAWGLFDAERSED